MEMGLSHVHVAASFLHTTLLQWLKTSIFLLMYYYSIIEEGEDEMAKRECRKERLSNFLFLQSGNSYLIAEERVEMMEKVGAERNAQIFTFYL